MTRHAREKQDLIIDAVRQGLEGDTAVNFVRESGYSMTLASIARNLRSMGGRGFVKDLIDEGKSNTDILTICLPGDDEADEKPSRKRVVKKTEASPSFEESTGPGKPLYDTAKLSIRLPSDVYEAVRLAARIERKSQNQLITDILTKALSQIPSSTEEA